MKSIFSALLITLSFNIASAANHEPEFCKIMAPYDGNVDEDTAFNTVTIDVRKAKTLSAFYLSLVNKYAVGYGYLAKPANLKEIQNYFKTEEQFNDLYLKVRTSKASGEVHIEVVSYPGDNAVGTVFNTKGDVIGSNGDDSYSYFDGQKEVYCSSEQ